MPKVKVETLQAGMVVAADVKTTEGMLLIPSGCALTEKQIGMLATCGIIEIQVRAGDGTGASVEPFDKLSPEARRKLAAELAEAFWTPPDANPVQKEVFDLALRRKARQRKAA